MSPRSWESRRESALEPERQDSAFAPRGFAVQTQKEDLSSAEAASPADLFDVYLAQRRALARAEAPSRVGPGTVIQRVLASELTAAEKGKLYRVTLPFGPPKTGRYKYSDAQGHWFQDTPGHLFAILDGEVTPIEEAAPSDSDDLSGDESAVDEDADTADLEAFNRQQTDNKPIVSTAVQTAVAHINSSLGGAGAFQENLVRIRDYLLSKISLYDEGHFLCSPDKPGDVNELAHSKGSGAIELFQGFFEANPLRQSELLIHEAVHSVLRVPDYAYMWQPIFRFLPIETQLRNPDSYVAVVRGSPGNAAETPTTGDDRQDRALGTMQHICMRGAHFISICKNQMDHFERDTPEPLHTLKAFRSGYSKDQLSFLIDSAMRLAQTVSGLILGGKVRLTIKEPPPTMLAGAEAAVNDGVVTVDLIASANHPPPVTTLARVMMALGSDRTTAVAVALSLNELADKGLMSSETLKPSGVD